MRLGNMTKSFRHFGRTHKNDILTIGGVVGLITAGIIAVLETPKAVEKINARKEELNVEKLPALETAKTVWKCYVPSVGLGVASAASVLGAHSNLVSQNAALMAAYAVSESALGDYKEASKELLGDKKVKDIEYAVADKKLKNSFVPSQTNYWPGNGPTRCFDEVFGSRFMADKTAILDAFNEFNSDLNTNESLTLNHLRACLGLENIESGEYLLYYQYDGPVIPEFTSHLDPDGVPCLAFYYRLPGT